VLLGGAGRCNTDRTGELPDVEVTGDRFQVSVGADRTRYALRL
jgi:hypothetical protein